MKLGKLLLEFERRYRGIPNESQAICEEIAKEFGLDVQETIDRVYINRYK